MEDFSTSGFKRIIDFGGVKTYASMNAVMKSDGTQLQFTGAYFVYLLHYKNGSCFFTLELDENALWKSADAPAFVESELIDLIGDSICQENF